MSDAHHVSGLPLVIGNWKMNGSRALASELVAGLCARLEKLSHVDIAVCPPVVYLQHVSDLLWAQPVALGAQDLSPCEDGAFTGDISASMLQDFRVRFVLNGHSERRTLHRESNELVAEKFARAIACGMTPVLCVGETLDERKQALTETVIEEQIQTVMNRVGVDAMASGVIAYEPVWAIGSGLSATPAQAQQVHRFIRNRLADHSEEVASQMRLLYGGSVKPDNALELFQQPDIDGGLIGGAALSAESFYGICLAAARSQPHSKEKALPAFNADSMDEEVH